MLIYGYNKTNKMKANWITMLAGKIQNSDFSVSFSDV